MKLYKFYLPKQFNNGKKVPKEHFSSIAREIEKRFGAYSLYPEIHLPLIQGFWKSPTGERFKEPMYLLELFTEDTFSNQEWLSAFKIMIK